MLKGNERMQKGMMAASQCWNLFIKAIPGQSKRIKP